MKKIAYITAAAGLVALAACNHSPREQAADNIEANADTMADNIDAAASNMSGNAADMLHNQADSTRAMGDNMAADMRTHDADTNLANGI